VIGVEAARFIFGRLAYHLGAGFVRCEAKKCRQRVFRFYESEYGQDTLEIHSDAVSPDSESIATTCGHRATARAVCESGRGLGGKIEGLSSWLSWNFLSEEQLEG